MEGGRNTKRHTHKKKKETQNRKQRGENTVTSTQRFKKVAHIFHRLQNKTETRQIIKKKKRRLRVEPVKDNSKGKKKKNK